MAEASTVLDLGAMAIVVGTVALGLEKVNMESSPLGAQLKRLQIEIGEAIRSFDVQISKVNPNTHKIEIAEICNNRRFHYLLAVACDDERKNYPKRDRFWYRVRPSYWPVPLLSVMRTGWHRWVIIALTILSIVCFFFQKAGQVYHFEEVWPVPRMQDVCLYAIYTTTILLTLLFAAAAHGLATVKPRCLRYVEKLHQEKERVAKSGFATMVNDLRDFMGGDTPAPR